MCQTSSRDADTYTNLEFGREVRAGDLTVEVNVQRPSEKTTKGGSVTGKEEQRLSPDPPVSRGWGEGGS